MSIIAVVTIGQSPRDDVVPELQRCLPGARFIEAGALDDLDDRAIEALAPRGDDFPLVTRLRDRRSVVVGEHAITPRLQAAITCLEVEADLAIVLCTGEFDLRSRKPLLFPGRILATTVTAVHGGRPVAVLAPHRHQVEQVGARWRAKGVRATVLAASPYEETDFEAVGRRARDAGAALVVMDCLGYSLAMKAAVMRGSGLPALLVRTLVARVAAELVE